MALNRLAYHHSSKQYKRRHLCFTSNVPHLPITYFTMKLFLSTSTVIFCIIGAIQYVEAARHPFVQELVERQCKQYNPRCSAPDLGSPTICNQNDIDVLKATRMLAP